MGAGNQTQGLMFMWQVLYQFNHLSCLSKSILVDGTSNQQRDSFCVVSSRDFETGSLCLIVLIS